jgi:hypothetical protein
VPSPSTFEKHDAPACAAKLNGLASVVPVGHGVTVEPSGMVSLVAPLLKLKWTRSGVT